MSMSASMVNTAADVVEVALGIARDVYGRVLSASRPTGKVRAGQWEFPGGKIIPGETPQAALVREWREELGVEVEIRSHPYVVSHRYPEQIVTLHVFDDVRILGQGLSGLEGQMLAWSPAEHLRAEDFVAGDRSVLARLRLPRFYVISDVGRLGARAWLRDLDRTLGAGPALVQLREHRLSDSHYAALADEAERVCRRHGAELVFNRDPEWVARRPCGGLHLTARALLASTHRPLPPGRWVGASCHDATELAHAEALGVDFATLAPVCPTASHPGAPAMGWETFRCLCASVALPIFAQGGLVRADLGHARDHGAHGLALLRGGLLG
ncbi:MAG: Nudix family hydrolase [Acidiferrobacteraceae bacterium]